MNSKESFGIRELYETVESRKEAKEARSETYSWFSRGKQPIGRKIVEEAVEVMVASHDDKKEQLVNELCDLLYFAFVLAAFHGIRLTDIENELANRHQSSKSSASKPIRSSSLKCLQSYGHAWSFTISEMLAKCGFTPVEAEELLKSNDAILFSHNFRKTSMSRVRLTNVFPPVTKDLKNAFVGHGYKAKLALSRGATPEYRPSRRSEEWVAPVIVVTNLIILPFCINILAAYVKDAIGGLPSHRQDHEEGIELDICIREASVGKEQWYRLRGTRREIGSILESLRQSIGNSQ